MTYHARTSPVFLHETGPHQLEVYAADGTQPSLTAHASLSITLVDYAGAVVQEILNAAIGRTDDANGNLTWTPSAETVSQERHLRLFLSGSGNVIAEVGFTVQYAPGA